ncbi:ATP-binding cassette sub-family B member 6-like [Antennarius striatus]|uniref:ATP-binding cassette sub-family B member 6-like n=1 Tax=Antennarius striatus TaxID=241820 RepID=UPI0035AE9475
MVFIQSYCENSSSISQTWVDQGISPCFYFTLVPAILLTITFFLGTIHCIFYQKYGREMEPKFIPRSHLYRFQQAVSVLLLVQFVSGMVWRSASGGELPGYVLLYGCFSVLSWCWAIALLRLERRRVMLMDRTRGHSAVLLLFWAVAFSAENLAFISWYSPHWWWRLENNQEKVQFALWLIRYITTGLLFFIGLKAPGLPWRPYMLMINKEERDVENGRQSLLGRTQENQSTWKDFTKKLRLLVPYMWPQANFFLQLIVIICLVLLAVERVVNVFVPIYYKNIVNELTDGSSWKTLVIMVCIYVLLKFLQGGGTGTSGFVTNMRNFLWIRVQQYTRCKTEVNLLVHLHSLSLRWHLSRKTGDVLKSIDRGTNSINVLLGQIIFNVLPAIIDVIISIIYFVTYFNAWFGLIVFVCMTIYLTVTIIIAEWRTKYYRDTNNNDNKAKAQAVDSLLNFETVKYYNTQNYEVNRFKDAFLKYQASEWKSQAALVFLSQIQNLIIGVSLLAGSLLCSYFVIEGKFKVGGFVLFGTYITQLYAPLNLFGNYYKVIQNSFVNMENMLNLFEEENEVEDEVNAGNLVLKQGKVEFDHVNFSYINGREILRDVSFTVLPGQTVALVGPSGSGKSTIIRLIFRLYDVHGGCISIDGQDISKVKQTSLRGHIGVVPQDTVLFNDTILNNIRYGRISASVQEVEEAAIAADIHDKIKTFPKGYESQVGERGLKLSGGEKQRVAIARTILKAPQIILLDEATSALDTRTERHIQESLNKMCSNRTTVVVAHRLSTIIGADQILVINEGQIVERGRHEELLLKGGLYADMWKNQQQALGSTSNSESRDRISEKQPSATSGHGSH